MKTITNIEEIPLFEGPIALTIGIYDGVHLGHQRIFKSINKVIKKNGKRVVLTFSNHPITLFSPEKALPLITSLQHRLHLLKSFSFDLAIVLPFDQALSNLSYETFIQNLYNKLPFTHLILGSDACFGKDRAGNSTNIRNLGEKLSFETKYLEKATYHNDFISSERIRNTLLNGDLKITKKMLGRPYSIHVPFKNPIKKNAYQYSLRLEINDLSPLPSAVYAVNIGKIPAVAFYRSLQKPTGHANISLTLYFEKPLPQKAYLELKFIAYLHKELDSELSDNATLLKNLIPQLKPS